MSTKPLHYSGKVLKKTVSNISSKYSIVHECNRRLIFVYTSLDTFPYHHLLDSTGSLCYTGVGSFELPNCKARSPKLDESSICIESTSFFNQNLVSDPTRSSFYLIIYVYIHCRHLLTTISFCKISFFLATSNHVIFSY